jgi:ABC-2 type transport system ATP-binding protein
MTGLDPLGRRDFREIILKLKQAGKTIFFSSHILADAEMISDRVGIIRHGNLVRETQLHELQLRGSTGIEVVFQTPNCSDNGIERLPWPVKCTTDGGIITINESAEIPDVVHGITTSGGTVVSVSPKRKTLEEVFIEEILS